MIIIKENKMETACSRSLTECLLTIEALYGWKAPGLVLGGLFMEDKAGKLVGEGIQFDAIVETRRCLSVAVQLFTPSAVGNGWLKIFDWDKFALTPYDRHDKSGFRGMVRLGQGQGISKPAPLVSAFGSETAPSILFSALSILNTWRYTSPLKGEWKRKFFINPGGQKMKILIILNDPPYGSERSYNALRLADQLVTRESVDLSLFLMGDAVLCAKAGQQTPQGYYNIERMLKPIVRKGEIILCGTCMDARGMKDDEVVDGARRGTLIELTDLTVKAEKVIVF